MGSKKYRSKYKGSSSLSKRAIGLLVTSLLALGGILLFGGEFAGYRFEGYLPKIQQGLTRGGEVISSNQQSGSGLYLSDGSSIPEYSGNQVIVVNSDKPFFSTQEINSLQTDYFHTYFGNDYLGRMTGVFATVTKEDLISSEGRPDLPDPVGWVGRSKGGVYDRCHGLAYTFSGRNDRSNLFTGTISLNQKYMVELEDLVRDYISSTGKSVLYRVTPVYLGDEKLPRGVLMEAYSKEATLVFNRFIYNVQDGFILDYRTGEVTIQ